MATSPRGADLMRGLGFDSRTIAGNALLLTVGDEPPRRGRDPPPRRRVVRRRERALRQVADLPRPRDRPPEQRPLARRRPWAAASPLPDRRPTSASDGAARRRPTSVSTSPSSTTSTPATSSSPSALRHSHPVDRSTSSSPPAATTPSQLGERLRERIYEQVVDSLSTAIARALAADAPLDESAPRARLPAHPADPLPAALPGICRGHPAPAAPPQRALHARLAQGARPRPRRAPGAAERPAQHLALGWPRAGMAGHRHRR